eukprot:gene20575-26681_t
MVDHPISDISSEDIIGLAIASSAGIGGGSIVIPLLLLLLHFSIDDAVPLGNAAVLGSTISNIVFTIFKPHPLALNRSIIDWDIVSMMEPNAMLGALLAAGMIAGLFGIGGGIVKAPLLIEMGVHPFVVSSTTTIMIFLTSLTAASSVISNVIGQTIVSRIVDIYKSSAVVTILIAVLVGISAVLMTLASIDI